jgi:hypothetical protein
MMSGMRDDVAFNGSSDPDEWLRWAREWRRAGRFEEALRAHQWYHANVLELDEAAYGVRLSFALADWVDLARVYRPALESLTETRSQAAAAAVENPPGFEAFHDALAIDRALGQEARAFDLILDVEAAHPQHLKEFYNHDVFSVLCNRGEYRRCRRWMWDPTHELDLAGERLDFDRSLTTPETIRQRAESPFVNRIVELTVVLLGIGAQAEANEIVVQARRHTDHPRLDSALDEARRILQERPPVAD